MNEGIWLWSPGQNKWIKAPADCPAKRMTATGLVYSGACKLHWIACSPSAGNSLWEITDDIDGSTAVVLDCFSTSRESKFGSFIPPGRFATGIYVKTFTNMTSILFGYTPE